jgi:hypothetical protein
VAFSPQTTLPTSFGGLGWRFLSLRLSGVAGNGNGGKLSPPEILLGAAFGGSPNGTNQSFSSANESLERAKVKRIIRL